MRSTNHKVRVLHGHTGSSRSGECSRWDGEIGLFFNTYSPGLHVESLAADGMHKGTMYRWVHIGCNTIDCRFDALVSVMWIEEMVQQALEAKTNEYLNYNRCFL